MEEISTFHSRQCAHLFVGGEELPCHLDLVTWQRVVPLVVMVVMMVMMVMMVVMMVVMLIMKRIRSGFF